MPQLHETRMGQQLITSTLPRIATALEELVEVLKKNQTSSSSLPNTPQDYPMPPVVEPFTDLDD